MIVALVMALIVYAVYLWMVVRYVRMKHQRKEIVFEPEV